MKYECPSCQSDNIQRLSVIYESGLANIKTTSTGAGMGYGGGRGGMVGGTQETTGKSQTVASKRAAPPEKQTYLAPLAFLFVLFFILGLMVDSALIHTLLNVGFLLAAGWWIYYAFQYNKKTWPPLKQAWDSTFLCNRCGKHFVLHDTATPA